MKILKQIILFLAILLMAYPAWAMYLSGYKVYYGTSSGVYSNNVTIGNVTTYAFTSASTNTYYFTVTALDDISTESDYSNEVLKYVASGATVTLQWDAPRTYTNNLILLWGPPAINGTGVSFRGGGVH